MVSANRNDDDQPLTDLSNAQLFLDDTIIEEANAVARRWHQPQKMVDPVLRADQLSLNPLQYEHNVNCCCCATRVLLHSDRVHPAVGPERLHPQG
jgi:hypothetical protein